MSNREEHWSRRQFVSGLTLAGTAGLLGVPAQVPAEPPPETARIRVASVPSVCLSPQYVAEEFLRVEGFTDVRYLSTEAGVPGAQQMGKGEIDISMNFAAPIVIALDAGAQIVVLGGIHVGCFELIATKRVRSVPDLKGKTVGVFGLGSGQHVFLSAMVAHVGLDPRKDVNFVVYPPAEAKKLLAEGKIDGYLGFPPDPQELREKKVGHVVVNSAVDRPWSQYFCCMLTANREFVARHPVATKRALRAILKGNQVCALEPARAARAFLQRGFTAREDHVVQALKEIPWTKWREFDPADTLRFYALRLHESGMIRSSPQKIIAQGTDWRFLNELKKELKG
ncbi:MAG: ABC transporter substrate-binding protein [Candidatus Rokuibacteriota bacterium]